MHAKRFPVIVSAVAALLAGCGAKEGKDAQSEDGAAPEPEMTALSEVPPSPLHDLYIAVDTKLEAGDKEGATRMMVGALDDAKFAEQKAELFTTLVRFLLYTEQVDEAKTRFLNIIRTEPELAMPGFDLIYGHYVQQGDAAATLEWVRQLLLQPLTPEMKRPAMEWLLVALLETGADDELVERLGTFVAEFPVDDAAQVLQRLCTTAQQAQKYATVDRMLDTVEAGGKKDESALAQVLLTGRVLAQLGREQWDAVDAAMPKAIDVLPDSSLQMLFANVASAMRRAKVPARLETVAEKLLRSVAVEKTNARNAAAREWVSAAVDQGNLALVPQRIGELIALKIPPRQVHSSISRHFYAMLEQPAIVKDMLVQADVLSPLLEEDSTRNALRALMLDACFVTEDYDRALKLLEERIADRDDEWHTMAIAKVKAHKALQEKKVDEAVKLFREFMEIIAKSKEDSPDPVSNVVHTRDMILGRNAKRIGDIYRDAGRADDAKKAYAEAKSLYDKALKANKAGEETEQLIRKEMGEIPQ